MNLVFQTKIVVFSLFLIFTGCSDGRYIPGDLKLYPVPLLDTLDATAEVSTDAEDSRDVSDCNFDTSVIHDTKK